MSLEALWDDITSAIGLEQLVRWVAHSWAPRLGFARKDVAWMFLFFPPRGAGIPTVLSKTLRSAKAPTSGAHNRTLSYPNPRLKAFSPKLFWDASQTPRQAFRLPNTVNGQHDAT